MNAANDVTLGLLQSEARNEESLRSATRATANEYLIQAAQAQRSEGLTSLHQEQAPAQNAADSVDVLCGPLLNFRRLGNAGTSGSLTWHGSVLIVTKPDKGQPELRLKLFDHTGGTLDSTAQNSPLSTTKSRGQAIDQERVVRANKLHEATEKIFWCFEIDVPSQDVETRWEYTLRNATSTSTGRPISPKVFVVPAKSESMRILFHSCNGFSIGTDEEAWSGPALWNDVLREHEQKPFHVMIGGGDQIYNDGIRVDGPLREWADTKNPKKRRDHPFGEDLKAECDQFYYKNYSGWYSAEPFAAANGQIPQINIWDDHDIIDGFGSYTDHFMRCPVFLGIGAIAYKYYCLFQHHVSPPASTDRSQINGGGFKPEGHTQYPAPAPCYIMGSQVGPYITHPSLSIYTQLGANVAFLGLDARTERTRHQINYPSTYTTIFSRVNSSLASNPNIKHLIVLLGVPIAYPRLAWLEQILMSPLIGPIKFLNKRFGVAGSFFNQFDGKPDLLDDLDDHYTARQHKHERKDLIQSLQHIASKHSVRVTILGGDVHLAALGSFYSNPKQALTKERDHRYMANIISSAITNHPPPKAVADLLARRNKVHHLDHETDETLIPLFGKDPGGVEKSSAFNKLTMPSRNYAIITENRGRGGDLEGVNGHMEGINGNGTALNGNGHANGSGNGNGEGGLPNGGQVNGNKASTHAPTTERRMGGLDVLYRVEIDQHDKMGHTDGYGFSIPPLEV